VFRFARLGETVVESLLVANTPGIPHEARSFLGKSQEAHGLVPAGRHHTFREQALLLEPAEFAFHPRRIAAIAKAGEIGVGDRSKRPNFGKGREFGIAKEIRTVAEVVRPRRVLCFRFPFFSLHTDLGFA
jgi:hypothetical protein